MAIKNIPINFRTYYKLFIENNKQKAEIALKEREELEVRLKDKYKDVLQYADDIKEKYSINLYDYLEFKENKYTTGELYKIAKGLFINKKNDYKLVAELYELYNLVIIQKDLYKCNNNINFYRKCSNLKLKEYTEILRIYYTEVHKKLILEGKGYSFGNNIGWICVNRCTFDKRKPMLDYAATKKREKELKEKGERIYNKEEADWCVRNGIEYKAADKRVFTYNEYCYQIPLIDCKLTNGDKLKLEIGDYRHRTLRGKSNDKLLELCNNNTTKICELQVDLKTKVTLCDKADKILYTKFIRNENQKPITFGTPDR